MTRTSATSATPAWDGDAISTKWIYGDGWFEFKAGTTSKRLMAGFADANPDRTWTSLLNAFYLKNDSTWDIRESGAVASGSPTGSYVIGDKFRIERTGTTVKYFKNDVAIWTSAVKSQGILFIDTSFYDGSGSIDSCLYFGYTNPEDVLWVNTVNTVGTYTTGGQGSQISKNLATSAYDSDAVSSKAIAGDGYLRFRIGQTTGTLAIGLAAANPDRNYTSLTFAFLATGSTVAVVESGTTKYSAGSYVVGDVFAIRRVGTQITYLKNDAVIYTSTVASTGNLFADCSIYTNAAKFTNCQIEGYPLAESPALSGVLITSTTSPTGSGLTSTAANGGAVTAAAIPGNGGLAFPTNGTLSFRFSQTSGKNVEGGLTTSRSLSPTAATINFGIKGRSDGLIEILEAGTSVTTYGSYATTDLFQVRRVGGMIEYLKNGSVLRSVAAPTGTLSGAFFFTETSGSVKDITFYTGQTDLLWRKQSHTTPSWTSSANGGLTRDTSTAGWTADALGTRQLVGDGYIQWSFVNTGKDAMVGLSPSDKNNSYTDLQYAIYANGSAGGDPLKIYENGANTGTFGTFTASDIYRIRRKGSTVYYSRIDSTGTESILKTSTITYSDPLVVDCSMQDLSVAITNCRIGYGDSDGDGLDDQWEFGEFGNLTQPGSGTGSDFDSDGIDNLHEFYNGTDPTDFYNGHPAQLNLISGNGQFSDPNSFVWSPLVVEVRDPSQPGSPTLANVPVKFTVQSGGGFVASQSGSSNLYSSIIVWTNASGIAQAYYKQPATYATDSVIRAQAGANAGASNYIDFAVHTHTLRGGWNFDETTGSTVLDNSPSSPKNDGQLQGSATRETSFDDTGAATDRALRLNGTTAYVSIADSTTLAFSGATFSVSAWVQFDVAVSLANDTDVYPVAAKWTASGNGFEFAIKGGTAKGISFRTMSNGATAQEIVASTDQRTKLNDGHPHFVAFTRDSANSGHLYVDGVEVSSSTQLSGSLTTSASVYLGRNESGRYFKGLIDDVRMLSTTLRSDEISATFDSDNDQLPDWWERKYFGNLAQSASGDVDSGGADGLTNLQEYQYNTNPNLRDTDNDGLTDGEEVTFGFKPLVPCVVDSTGTVVSFNLYTPLEF